MTICEKYKTCEEYDVHSQACTEDSIAIGYCGIRKQDNIKNKKDKKRLELGDIIPKNVKVE